jgi:methyltransferase (TIGR00027 family)
MNREPSETALTAAAARAAHLVVDKPPYLFDDSAAVHLLGQRAAELMAYHQEHGRHPILRGARSQAVTRARYTEDAVAAAAVRGTSQYVILGAGLDSFAHRVVIPGLRVFEVDHPASQDSKQDRARGLPIRTPLTYVPADLEQDDLASRLTAAGFDPDRPAIVAWLGVTMYLTGAAVASALAGLGGLAPGTEVIADYMLPAALRDTEGQLYAEQVGAMSAERGEPWLTCLSPSACTALFHDAGFRVARQLTAAEALGPELWRRDDPLTPSGLAMLAHARLT